MDFQGLSCASNLDYVRIWIMNDNEEFDTKLFNPSRSGFQGWWELGMNNSIKASLSYILGSSINDVTILVRGGIYIMGHP